MWMSSSPWAGRGRLGIRTLEEHPLTQRRHRAAVLAKVVLQLLLLALQMAEQLSVQDQYLTISHYSIRVPGPGAQSQRCSWLKAKKYLASIRAAAAVASLASLIVLHDAHIDCVYWASLPPEAAGLWPFCLYALDDDFVYTPPA